MSKPTAAIDKPKDFDTEFLFRAPEIYVFSACSHVVDLVVAAREAAGAGAEDAAACDERLRVLFSQLWGLAVATQRFDIILPLMSDGTLSPFFWRWFNWWQDYRKALTPEELDQVRGLLENSDPGALEFRPSGDWLTHRATMPPGVKLPPLHPPSTKARAPQRPEPLKRWSN